MSLKTRKTLGAVLAAGLTVSGLAAFQASAAADVEGPNGVLVYGLTTTNQLVQFRSDDPAAVPSRTVAITGAPDLVGIDVRPATGELYGVGVNSTLYVIDPATGVAVARGAAFTPALSGSAFGIDFNPAADRLRINSDTNQTLNINPDTGGTAVAVGTLAYEPGDVREGVDPAAVGAAYTNNVAPQAAGATTRLIDYDVAGQDVLAQQVNANAGTLRTLATPTVSTTPIDVPASASGTVGLDIEAVTNDGLALLRQAGGPPALYAFDVPAAVATTGGTPVTSQFRLLGLSSVATLEDVAIASPRFSVLDTTTDEGTNAVVTVQRTGDLTATATVVVTPTAATGTATSGSDFDPTARTAVFGVGAATATVSIAIPADGVTEGTETFTVLLSDLQGGSGNESIARRQGTVTINDTSTGGTVPAPGPGTGTGTTSPSPSAGATASPSASASPTASATASPTATGTPSPGSVQCVNPAGIRLDRGTITPGVGVRVTVTAAPNSVVELRAYSRPSTTYRVVRTASVGSTGSVVFTVLPGTNTRLFANCVAQTRSASASVVINVRTALSLTVVRNGSRDYTFQGRILPRRAGQLISLYRVTNDGREILTSQLKTDSSGTYRIRRVFTGSGVFGFLTRTGQTLTNAAGVSNGGRARPTAIYAGPQR